MTSLLSFLIFVCPPPHLHHLPTPSDLICLPSAASAPTPRCTHATMLCLCLDQTPTQSSCDLADDSPNLRRAISIDNWYKMLLLLVYQIFVHTKIIANLLLLTSCVKHFKKVWSPERSGNKTDFFFSSRRRHTRSLCDWSSDVCSSD